MILPIIDKTDKKLTSMELNEVIHCLDSATVPGNDSILLELIKRCQSS